ncbi:MAG: TIGR04282 family arsenosugar biosynthesis glycosyltransferase [Pseudomonadota bacterium]
MLKVPRAGQVKTRLGHEIGMTRSAWWFRHQVTRLLRRLEDPRWQTVLAVAPDRDGLTYRRWPEHLVRVPQGRGDLGARMGRVMRGLPPGPVCIIGGDIPGVRQAHVARAFKTLGDHDAVFGPAPDGGYWLVGLKRAGRVSNTLFQNVRWSTKHALSDTMAGLPDARIAIVDTLQDVDTASDLRLTCASV